MSHTEAQTGTATAGQQAASCLGKHRFASAVLAHRASKRRKRRHVYRCRYCGFWHVGERIMKPRGKPRTRRNAEAGE